MDNATKCIHATAGPMVATPLKTLKDNIQSCVNEFIEELEECLPEDAKDWPQLSFDTMYSLLDFMYENKEEIFC